MHALNTDDPRRIGNYAILHRLGQGGMGSVYLGRSRSGRPVAVKVARAELVAEPEFRERFHREVELARRVGGFWTAAVVDADPDAERPWLATEYVAGPSLRHAVDAGNRLPEPAALHLAAGLAEALAAIHATGLVHRDLKPSNVLLGHDGPRVIDFGIAHAVQHTSLTATGQFVGTPGYLSPEQISGAPVGPPSDVFALGAVLVFATTGIGPFGQGAAQALIHRAAQGEARLDGVPGTVRDVASMCLRHTPESRPTPEQVLQHLTEHAEPASEAWWPPAVRTLIDQHRTRLRTALDTRQEPQAVADTNERDSSPKARPSAEPHARGPRAGAPPAEPDPAEAAPRGAARFRTSRIRSAIWAGANALGAVMVSGLGNPLFPPEVRLTGTVATTVFAALAAALALVATRPQRTLEVTADGLAIARGRRHWHLPWWTVARTRVTAGPRGGLAVWLASATDGHRSGLLQPYHGGFRVYPLTGFRRRRRAELRELRAALVWYAADTHDPAR